MHSLPIAPPESEALGGASRRRRTWEWTDVEERASQAGSSPWSPGRVGIGTYASGKRSRRRGPRYGTFWCVCCFCRSSARCRCAFADSSHPLSCLGAPRRRRTEIREPGAHALCGELLEAAGMTHLIRTPCVHDLGRARHFDVRVPVNPSMARNLDFCRVGSAEAAYSSDPPCGRLTGHRAGIKLVRSCFASTREALGPGGGVPVHGKR